MKIVDPSYKILTIDNQPMTKAGADEALRYIEYRARNCYKSEGKIRPGSAAKLVRKLVSRGHWPMLEFGAVGVQFINDRGFTHELVRHRIASYAQESTRYCDYDGELTVVRPVWWAWEQDSEAYTLWEAHMRCCEDIYQKLRSLGEPAERARQVLPISTKAEIHAQMNFTAWRHVFNMRCALSAHPMMRAVMWPLLAEFAWWWPDVYLAQAEELLGKDLDRYHYKLYREEQGREDGRIPAHARTYPLAPPTAYRLPF
jgi:thymidylate synthase (FAD)